MLPLAKLLGKLANDGDQNLWEVDVVAIKVVVRSAKDHEILRSSRLKSLLQQIQLRRFSTAVVSGEHLSRVATSHLNAFHDPLHDSGRTPHRVQIDVQVRLIGTQRSRIELAVDAGFQIACHAVVLLLWEGGSGSKGGGILQQSSET